MKWDYWVGQDEFSDHLSDQLSNQIIKVERGTGDLVAGFWNGPFTFGKFLLPRVGKIRAAHIHDYTPHYEEWE